MRRSTRADGVMRRSTRGVWKTFSLLLNIYDVDLFVFHDEFLGFSWPIVFFKFPPGFSFISASVELGYSSFTVFESPRMRFINRRFFGETKSSEGLWQSDH